MAGDVSCRRPWNCSSSKRTHARTHAGGHASRTCRGQYGPSRGAEGGRWEAGARMQTGIQTGIAMGILAVHVWVHVLGACLGDVDAGRRRRGKTVQYCTLRRILRAIYHEYNRRVRVRPTGSTPPPGGSPLSGGGPEPSLTATAARQRAQNSRKSSKSSKSSKQQQTACLQHVPRSTAAPGRRAASARAAARAAQPGEQPRPTP